MILPALLFALATLPVPIQETVQTRAINNVATGMVVDKDGSVFMTGYSRGLDSGYDYLTVKYDSGGNVVWAKRYDGPAKGDDRPVAICLDSKGAAYVTGASAGGDSGSDYLTIKYDSTGNVAWTKRFNGAGNGLDRPTALAVDASDDLVVTGFSAGQGSGYDCVTVKYDAAGNEIWRKAYNGAENGDDFGSAIRCDGAGNVYVAGYSRTGKSAANYLLIKYAPDGKSIWARTYGSNQREDARAVGLVITSHGSICVTGYAGGSHGASDIVTLAYDPNGQNLWSYRYDGIGHGEDKPTGLGTDRDGDIIVIGASAGRDSGKDFVTTKLSPEGKPTWSVRYDGSGNGDDIPIALAVARDGSIAVTGHSIGTDSGSDIVTLIYDSAGKQLWLDRYNGEANDVDRPIGVGIGADGAVYVAGSSWGGKGKGFEYITIKYSRTGERLWVKRFGTRETQRAFKP